MIPKTKKRRWKGYQKKGTGCCGMKPSWTHQNELNNNPEYEMPASEEMIRDIWSIRDRRARLLVMLLYLTAGRISEVLSLVPENFADRPVWVDGVRKKIFLIQMRNLKNRTDHVKRIPLDYAKWSREINFIKSCLGFVKPYERVFRSTFGAKEIGRSHAYTIVKEATGYNPHWIRHIRLTNRCLEEGMSSEILQKQAGWTDTAPAKYYVRTRWTDLIEK